MTDKSILIDAVDKALRAVHADNTIPPEAVEAITRIAHRLPGILTAEDAKPALRQISAQLANYGVAAGIHGQYILCKALQDAVGHLVKLFIVELFIVLSKEKYNVREPQP